jgi:hypothetical protein
MTKTNRTPARIDADLTAKPKTRLVAKADPSKRISATNATHYESEDGSRVAMAAEEPSFYAFQDPETGCPCALVRDPDTGRPGVIVAVMRKGFDCDDARVVGLATASAADMTARVRVCSSLAVAARRLCDEFGAKDIFG